MSCARTNLSVATLLLSLAARAGALTIALDYSFDAQNGNYFGTHAEARLSLEKAASDLGNLLATSPGGVSVSSFSATSGGTTVRFDWTLSIRDPATGVLLTQQPVSAAADTVTMHVGFRPLGVDNLGMGEFTQAKPTVFAPTSGDGLVTAAGVAEGASNATMSRGDVPAMEAPILKFGGATAHLRYGNLGGSVWFDDDTNNDNQADLGTLGDYWHFGLDAPAAGKYDFYSVALRGMVQALGFGASSAWRANADGTNWKGSYANALFGNDGTNLITTDGQIAAGLGGGSLHDGTTQIAVMAPGLGMGTRRYLTTLDVAMLEDTGYRFVPEPQTGVMLAMGALLWAGRRRSRFRLCEKSDCDTRARVASLSPWRIVKVAALGWMLFSQPAWTQAPKPGGASAGDEELPTVKGPAGQPAIPVQRAKGVAGTLIFLHGATGPLRGQLTKVIASSSPAATGTPADLSYDKFLGPMTMKSLDQVMRSVVAMHHGWPQGQKLQLTFSERPSPSELNPATLAGALAIDSMLRNYDIDPAYAAIGWIQEDGRVAEVGGIPERLSGAGAARVARIAVPEKNYEQVSDFLLSGGIGAFVGTQVFTVKDFNEAGVLALTKLDPKTQEVVTLFGSLQRTMAYAQGNVGILKTEGTQGVLRKVLEAAPNHCSAQVLLDWGTGKKATMTFDGSVDVIDRRAAGLLKALRAKAREALAMPREQIAQELAAIKFVYERVDPRARAYANAIYKFGDTLQKSVGTNGRPPAKMSASMQTALDVSVQQGNDEWEKLVKTRQAIAEERQKAKAQEKETEAK